MKVLISAIIIMVLFMSCNESKEKQVSKKISFKSYEKISLASGSLKRIDSFPSKMIVPRTVDVWLPEGYTNRKEYAVLYMHDGQNLFDTSIAWQNQEWKVDEIVSSLITAQKIKDIIVVAIWNIPEIRHQDYFPEKAYDLLAQRDKDSLMTVASQANYKMEFTADEYLEFIVSELKPEIDAQFSTLSGPNNTFIAGSSMGGLISMYAVCEYPDVFGGAACLSTHWPGLMPAAYNPVPNAFFSYMKTKVPAPGKHHFYFDYGTETLDAYYPQYLNQVDSVFFGKGYSEKNYMNLEFEGADHTANSWNRRLDIPLEFLLKK